MAGIMGRYGVDQVVMGGMVASVAINVIPDVAHEYGIEYKQSFVTDSKVETAHKALLMLDGALTDHISRERSELKNPLKWFVNGVKAIFQFPFYLLAQFGIISSNTQLRVNGSRAMNLISGLASLITIASFAVQLCGEVMQ